MMRLEGKKSFAWCCLATTTYLLKPERAGGFMYSQRYQGMSSMKRFVEQQGSNDLYITTPIYYVNALPHIGHAYTSVASDTLSRYAKLEGNEAYLVTGTDEHGEKVAESAEKMNEKPYEYATRISKKFQNLADSYEIKYDAFVRTTSKEHATAVEALWKRIEEKDDIYLGAYEGWYCVRDECYYTESELIDGKAPTGAEVEWRTKEASYFFRLSKYQDFLIKKIQNNDLLILPETRKNEVLSFLTSQPLRDLSISRTTFDWGLKVPGDHDHVIYVWIDALTNYLTALNFPESESLWSEKYQQKVHFVGKDILRFHAIYWPAILASAGLPLPSTIVAHGWWTKDGQKISKSLGNAIDPLLLLDAYGLDATRYFLLAEVPFGQDGDYSREAMLASTNGFLANAVGNLAQRISTMLTKPPCQSQAPHFPDDYTHIISKYTLSNKNDDTVSNELLTLLQRARNLPKAMRPYIQPTTQTNDTRPNVRFDLALREIETIVRDTNKFFDASAPWKLKKTNPDAMISVLAISLDLLRCIALAYQPFMPDAAAAILDQIGVPPDERSFNHFESGVLAEGAPIAKPKPIFPRIDPESLPDDI